ncbi:MAG: methyltransferase domain-containing protein [Alphaproteobacteria bacterium]|nr:methyltransferase domain-containing protein [Alphaproteobacteria bacterium]
MSFVSTMASAPSPSDRLAKAQNLLESGRPAESAALLKSLIVAGRAGLLARIVYSKASAAAGDLDAAAESARDTALLYPHAATAALALGEALLSAERLPTAIAELQRALRIDPELLEARYGLGCAWLQAGEPDKALEEFARIPEERAPADIGAKRAQAAYMSAAPRANAAYVRHLFDQFSAQYDARMLGQLAYRAPGILRELAALVVPNMQGLAILDLGCGTGLSGLAFRALATRLDGVDLSPAMIEKARARGIYDRLVVADIEAPISDAYDLIVAADTLVYLGDIRKVLTSACEALSSGGVFLFTVEKDAVDRFSLGPKRRWRHSEAYLRGEAQRQGLDVAALIECSPRTEAGMAVEGFAVALRKG